MPRQAVIILALLTLCAGERISAQCTTVFSLGNDTTLCEGATIVLNAGPGYQSYAWSTGSSGQSITVGNSGVYTCTVTDFGTTGELVVNGAFNAGASGFSSGYAPGTGGTYGLLSNAGTYAVSTSPQLTHTNFQAFGDHTTGTGNMLVVNGADAVGQNVWCQTVAVAPNTDYAFSAWLATAISESPAQLVFTVNGITVGDPLLAPWATGQWVNFYDVWNSGASTVANICISNQNSQDSGNDFALDDISFAPFCTYSDAVNIDFQAYPEPDLGADVRVCAGIAVVLDGSTPGADTYAWQNGSTAFTFAPAGPGTYWVDVTENGCTTRDSVDVIFDVQPTVYLGADEDLCAGETILLNALFPGASYQWQNGADTPSLTASATGIYWVVVDVDGCTATDTIALTWIPLPIVELGPDTTICADTTLLLDVFRSGGSYLWDDGSTTAQRTLSEPGVYHVLVSENGCTATDSLELGNTPLPYVDLGPDFLLCTGTRATLDARGAGYTYLWNTEDTTSTIVIDEEGRYAVRVTSRCGVHADSLVVTQERCDCPVFVPNAFTPNGIGPNEEFRPQFDCPVEDYRFVIFDRWGRELWYSDDPMQAWDGGGSSPDGTALGVYAWQLEIRPQTVNENKTRKMFGHVLLLR